MITEFLFDWSLATVSMFNTIVLFWLGLTVLLNADKRTWSVWLAASGLLLGGVFFLCHTATLDYSLEALLLGITSWWYLSWLSVIALPLGWYVLMLSYAGFWESRQSALYQRQSPLLLLNVFLALVLMAIVVRVDPTVLLHQVTTSLSKSVLPLRGVSLILVLFPFFLLLCLVLSIDALYRPGPTSRMMGDIARRRARPWLLASSLVQLVISLLVMGTLLWIVLDSQLGQINTVFNSMLIVVNILDFIITLLIATAVILLGKAIVSYEIFTGKTLPRSGFLRQWRSIVILAAAYSILVSLSWAIPKLRLVYPLLLTTVLTSIFYAIFSWRSYVEREDYMARLRPFVRSQHLYEHLLTHSSGVDDPPSAPELNALTPFRALCEDVLGAQVAYLVALGPLAPLVGPALTYPPGIEAPLVALNELIAQFNSPRAMCVELDASRYSNAVWAVPLWSERGLIGVLFLGEKRDGGLYTQEEMEIARASGERLIDTQASAAMAQRLMGLQRQRLAESQLLDRRTRRILHDDILPCLHTTMLTLSQHAPAGSPHADALTQMADVHRQISNLLHEMPTTTAPAVARLGLVGALRQTVNEELNHAFDEVSWQIDPPAEQHAQAIPSLTAEVLFYAAREAMRNAARYGRGDNTHQPLHLRVSIAWNGCSPRQCLELVVEDNGVGLEAASPANGGSGHGLALHSTMMAVVGGSLATESVPGQFTRVVLTLPQESW
ncbi:MAG: hypothetical protein JO316_10845 [Abitibacteriaceae bacterium]|nr:hypothetical protein [Abditibacteriaceae bacterium]